MHGDNSVFAIVVCRINLYNLNVTNGLGHLAAAIFLDALFVPRNLDFYNLCMRFSIFRWVILREPLNKVNRAGFPGD
jgi:hypothetical protein